MLKTTELMTEPGFASRPDVKPNTFISASMLLQNKNKIGPKELGNPPGWWSDFPVLPLRTMQQPGSHQRLTLWRVGCKLSNSIPHRDLEGSMF